MKLQTSLSKYIAIIVLAILMVSCDSLFSHKINSPATTKSQTTSSINPGGIVTGTLDPLLQQQYSVSKNLTNITTNYTSLLNLIKIKGTLPIIIRLNVPFTPEGLLTAQQIQQQRLAIQNTQQLILNSLSLLNISAVKKYKYIPYLAMQVNQAALLLLTKSQYVLNIVQDKAEPVALTEKNMHQIGADSAWAAGYTGKGYTIAILDDGVDESHPALKNKIVDQGCFSSNVSSSNAQSLCPNGKDEDFGTNSGGKYQLVHCQL